LYFGAVFITRREGAAFIGVAYSTDQLETKTNEKSRVGWAICNATKIIINQASTGSF
jgi:hypothetical protein